MTADKDFKFVCEVCGRSFLAFTCTGLMYVGIMRGRRNEQKFSRDKFEV